VVLEGGRIRQVAPPQEVYARPSNVFVAGFIGSPRINLVRPETLRLEKARRGVIAGVRPHDVSIGAGEVPEGAVPGWVYLVEPMGSETWVTLEIAGEHVIGRAVMEVPLRTGEAAWARYEAERVMLFDARTEERIEGGG